MGTKKKRYKKPQSVKDLEADYHNAKIEAYPAFPYPPVTKFRDDTSNGLTKCIITFIQLNNGQAERISNTGRYVDNSKVVTDVIGRKRRIGSGQWVFGTGRKGTADISATIKGLSVKIEVKCEATKDRQSQDQKDYQKEVEDAGGIYVIARNFTQFREWYNQQFN